MFIFAEKSKFFTEKPGIYNETTYHDWPTNNLLQNTKRQLIMVYPRFKFELLPIKNEGATVYFKKISLS
jgi:hypothetical protein